MSRTVICETEPVGWARGLSCATCRSTLCVWCDGVCSTVCQEVGDVQVIVVVVWSVEGGGSVLVWRHDDGVRRQETP
eukprot:4884494-Prymnesium_polylepis.1